jgi:hypothetical protein
VLEENRAGEDVDEDIWDEELSDLYFSVVSLGGSTVQLHPGGLSVSRLDVTLPALQRRASYRGFASSCSVDNAVLYESTHVTS